MRIALAALLLLSCLAAHAQTATRWVARGDAAAASDQHAAAIDAYQQAIANDPSLRPALLAKIGRQLLWSDHPSDAATLLSQYMSAHPAECDVRSDYALALAWSDQYAPAHEQNRILAQRCGAFRGRAMLRDALIYRWEDRPSIAESIYQRVESEGTPAEQRDARIGLAFVALMRDENRVAEREFRELFNPAQPETAEGLSIALLRLGRAREAMDVINQTRMGDRLGRSLRDVNENLSNLRRWQLRSAASSFHEADGLNFRALEIAASEGWRLAGRGELAIGNSRLADDATSIDGRWIEANADQRWSPLLAVRAVVRVANYDEIQWSPWSGEVDAAVTSSDRSRIDVSLARLLVTDNIVAMANHLNGTFVSAGTDRSLGRGLSATVAADVTQWSTDNRRSRLRVIARKQFEGVPRITIEWPTVVQFYDEPFAFRLWSPNRYFETGPGFNTYRRWRRVWNLSAYIRAGTQRESDEPWRFLGVARAAIERDLVDGWAVRASAGWSNSNLSSSGGFRRASSRVEFVKRF